MERIKPKEYHDSMRGYFAGELHGHMAENADIWVVTGDLGFGMFDRIRADFPDRFVNVGAAEQGGVGVACGMAQRGKIPFFYSITPFSLYRPYEWLRNYVDHEELPVKIIGAGRDKDYAHDGFTHWSEEAKPVLQTLPNIVQYWPETKDEIPDTLTEIIGNGKPSFISLRR